MKLNDWTITPKHGPRPAGPPDECFHCHGKLGEQHKFDCPRRTRSIVLRMTVEYVVDVPEHWDEESIRFARNDSSWCANNALVDLERQFDAGNENCMCNHAEFEYVREATEEETVRAKIDLKA